MDPNENPTPQAESTEEKAPQESTNQDDNPPQKDDQPPKMSAAEVRARSNGWVPLEEWEAQGNDPNEWVSANRYNEKGELIDVIKSLQSQVKGFDQRIADNNALWSAKLQAERETLEAQRDEAIDLSDKAKVKQLDKQINAVDMAAAKLQAQNPQQPNGQQNQNQQANPADIQAENAFFATLTSRAQRATAQAIAGPLLAQGITGQKLVDLVQTELHKEFPVMNNRRNNPSKTDTSRRPAAKSDDPTPDTMTMNDRLALDAMRRSSSKYANKSDADMLKILKDSKL